MCSDWQDYAQYLLAGTTGAETLRTLSNATLGPSQHDKPPDLTWTNFSAITLKRQQLFKKDIERPGTC